MACIVELIGRNPKKRKELVDSGIVSTLKRISELTGGGSSPCSRSPGHIASIEEGRDIVDLARTALEYLEQGGSEDD